MRLNIIMRYAYVLSGIMCASPTYSQDICKIGIDLFVVAKSCSDSEKASISSGSKTAECTHDELKISAPEGYYFPKETIKVDAVFNHGGDHKKEVKSNTLTIEEESDFLMRNAMSTVASAWASCKTDRGAGSNCDVGATLSAIAVNKKCLPNGLFGL